MSEKFIKVPFPQGEKTWAQMSQQAIEQLQKRLLALETATSGISGTDEDAIHDNVSDEIHAITAKTVPVAADVFLGEDSANSWSKIRVAGSNMPAGYLASATTLVDTKSSTAPSAGYALLATSSSAATWQSLAGKDSTAIHTTVSGEINSLSAKTALVGNDLYVIEDSESSNAKKKVIASNNLAGFLKSATTQVDVKSATAPSSGYALIATGASAATWQSLSGKDTDAFHAGVSSEFHGLTELTAVAQDDEYAVEDQSASYAKKRVQAKNALAGYVASATTQIDLKSSTAPSAGMSIIATGDSAATWQYPTTLSLWFAPPASPGSQDDEFTSDTSANWTFSPSLSGSAIDVYSTITTNPRVSWNTARTSHLAFQPADATFCAMTKSFTISTNDYLWARFTPSSHTTAASATVMNYALLCWSADSDVSGDYIGCYIEVFLTTGPRVRYVKKISGVTTEIATALTLDKEPSMVQHVLLQKISTTYHAWVGSDSGNWLYLGSTTYAGATLDNRGMGFFDDGGTPGTRLTYIDFFRHGSTTLNPLP